MATQKKTTDVATYDHLKLIGGSESVKGLAPMSEEMLMIPRIKLVQPLSVEVSELGYKAGVLVDSISKDVLCEDGELIVVPIMYKESRIMYKSIESGGGVLCQSKDAVEGLGEPGGSCRKCEFAQWVKRPNDKTGEMENIQDCCHVANVVCIPINVPVEAQYPIIASFMKTSFPTGKRLINAIYQKRVNPWHFQYSLFTELVKGKKGTYYEMRFKPSGRAPIPIVQYMESIFDMLQLKDFETHYDEEEAQKETDAMNKEGEKF